MYIYISEYTEQMSGTSNTLENLYMENSNVPWNYDELSRNPNLTLYMLTCEPLKPWNWGLISLHPNITTDFIISNPAHRWDWNAISSRDFTITDIIRIHLEIPNNKLNWTILVNQVDLLTIHENPTLPWDYSEMTQKCTAAEIMENPDMQWDWSIVSLKNVSLDMIFDLPDKNWDYTKLSANPNLTSNFVRYNYDKPWDWSVISRVNHSNGSSASKVDLAMDVLQRLLLPVWRLKITLMRLQKERELLSKAWSKNTAAIIKIQNWFRNNAERIRISLSAKKAEEMAMDDMQ